MDKAIKKPVLASLLASPIGHSLSPVIHNTAFAELNINGQYTLVDTGSDSLESCFAELRQSTLLGCNLSMPNKQLAIPLVDDLSDTAKVVGAINTVIVNDGKLFGDNTDGRGFVKGLEVNDIVFQDKTVLILGAGGAALSIIYELAKQGVSQLVVLKRQNDTFDQTVAKMEQLSTLTNCPITVIAFSDELQAIIESADIIVNCTNVGMAELEDETPLDPRFKLSSHSVVVDIIYVPKQTELLKWAEEQGCRTLNGLDMLIYQASEAFKLWTAKDMPIIPVKEAVKNRLENNDK